MSGQSASQAPLTARAAAAFEAYRGGDVEAMSELVDLLTVVSCREARIRCKKTDAVVAPVVGEPSRGHRLLSQVMVHR